MIPVAIGLFFFIFLVVGLTSNSTSPVNRATPPGRIVDVLDEDPRFTTLVATLRRNGLASYLNAVEGATFFAPTDNAFHGQNGQFTHETLLYHLLPVRVNGGGLTNGLVLETDLIKAGSLGETGHIGQRVKIERTGSWWTGEKVVVGGAPVVQMDKGAENGVIHVLDKVLVPPHELSDAAAAFPTLTTFSELLDASGLHSFFSQSKPYTIFAPESNAFGRFTPFQMAYLKHKLGSEDAQILIKQHVYEGLLFSSEIQSRQYPVLQGNPLQFRRHWFNSDIEINNGLVKSRDILASNGLLHSISTIFIPADLNFTTRKYLIGQDVSQFVTFLDEAGLGHFLDGTESVGPVTFLAPIDDAFAQLPANATERKRWMEYHIVAGKMDLDALEDGQLIETELVEEGLGGKRQRVKVEFVGRNVLFNQVEIVKGPVIINNLVVYTMPSLLMPPPSALNQLKVDLRFSTFKAYLQASGLDPNILDSHTTSLLAPTNGAFARLGFTNQYLLLPESRNYLRSIIQHHIVEGVLYSADIDLVPVQYPTLAAQQLSISKRSNDVFARNPKTDPGDRDHVARTTESDILVSTGVVHAVDRILFPPTVKITNADLLRAINATIMLQILAAVDEDLLTSKAERTILAPTDDAFHRVNLTRIFADPEILAHVARLHVILAAVKHENDDQGHVSLKGGIRYPTLLSPQQTIMIEKSKAGRLTVQVSNRRWGENADAHVVAFGESYTGGVVIIDCVLLIQEDILGWEGFNGWSVVFIIFKVVGSVVMVAMCVWQRGIMKNRSGYEALRDASEV